MEASRGRSWSLYVHMADKVSGRSAIAERYQRGVVVATVWLPRGAERLAGWVMGGLSSGHGHERGAV